MDRKRHILITNDDGILADGLIRLARAAQAFGEVWVIAPEGQRSAMSHCISLHSPIDFFPSDFPLPGVHAWASTGTPADCVRVGSLNLVPDHVDAVLSGINFGYNCATDLQYSATVGAAFEGAFQGITSIAFSEGTGSCHAVTDTFLPGILEELLDRPLDMSAIWNVNFPDCPLSELDGILRDAAVSRGLFYKDCYEEEPLPEDGRRFHVRGTWCPRPEAGTDLYAVTHQRISVGIARNIGSDMQGGH